MDNRTNVIAMMVLGAGIVALGSTIVTGEMFKSEKPEHPGYVVEGVAEAGAAPAGPVIPFATLMAQSDVKKGEAVFAKCGACHNAASGGPNAIGPNLYGVVGHARAGHAGFDYSAALKGKAGNWDFASLNEWLTSPQKYADGTKMTFAGLEKPEDRANVIAYLNAQGSNLPMPKAEAAPTAPAAGAKVAPAAAAPAKK